LHADNAAFSLQFYCSLLLPLLGVLVARTLGRGSTRNWWLTAVALTVPALWVKAALPQDFWDKIGISAAPTLTSVIAVLVLVSILSALAVVGVRRRDGSWLLPVAVGAFSLAWMAIATTLNWWGRMQWPLLPVLAAIAVTHVVWVRPSVADAVVQRRRTPAVVVAGLVVVGIAPFHLPIGGYFESPFQSAVSDALRSVDTSRVRIATTEAGLIPLAVTGTALDTYGHNNRSIAASHGGDLDDQLNTFRPNMIAMHGLPPAAVRLADCTARVRAEQRKFPAVWSQMVDKIYAYTERAGMTLARVSETTPCETWSIWLADDVDPQVRVAVQQLSMPGTDVTETVHAGG
jgi:hypothetical protein